MAVNVCGRRAGANQFASGLVALVRAVVRSESGAILGLSKRAALTTGVSRPLWSCDSTGYWARARAKGAASREGCRNRQVLEEARRVPKATEQQTLGGDCSRLSASPNCDLQKAGETAVPESVGVHGPSKSRSANK